MAANRHGLFWNSVGNDRLYDADSFSEWLSKFFTTGVFANELQVSATSGLGIAISPGYANIEGKVRFFDEISYLTLSPANPSYPRIDTVVIERNNTNREITLKIVTGSLSGSTPRATSPIRNSAIYQLVLAEISLPAGATAITQSNVKDKRLDSAVCGIVKGTVEEINAEQFHAQLTSQFTDWFNGIKGKLGEDLAGNLQQQITASSQAIEENEQLINGIMQGSMELSGKVSSLEEKATNLEKKINRVIFTVLVRTDYWSASKVCYVQDVKIKANSKITVCPIPFDGEAPDSSYINYLENLKKASIVPFRHANNRVYLFASGEKPTVNLNLQFIVEGE